MRKCSFLSITWTLHPTWEKERVTISKYPLFNTSIDLLLFMPCTCHLGLYSLGFETLSLSLSFFPSPLLFRNLISPLSSNCLIWSTPRFVSSFRLSPLSLSDLTSSRGCELSCLWQSPRLHWRPHLSLELRAFNASVSSHVSLDVSSILQLNRSRSGILGFPHSMFIFSNSYSSTFVLKALHFSKLFKPISKSPSFLLN